ncbi:MAG TPA: ROK family protein [Candidatus Saccharimonadales bacterium]|nr:ROK family protein [Candidatus Saccharimonadales bacterium]
MAILGKSLQSKARRAKLAVKMSYLGIDLGGSKTIVAVFDSAGKIIVQKKFPTNNNYENFIRDVEKNVDEISTNTNIACSVAVPGLISRDTGVVHALGNLDWKDKPIRDDISKAIGGIPVIIENDARTAGLAEADVLYGQYKRILYLTISTGIGGALIDDGKIAKDLEDTEMGQMPLLYEGKIQTWENFASGKAIEKKYDKQASEIQDEEQWKEIGGRIGYGLAVCCSILQPQAVVFGGGAGQFADKFKGHVSNYLDSHLSPLVRRPEALLAPAYVQSSAITGCFLVLKQHGLIE